MKISIDDKSVRIGTSAMPLDRDVPAVVFLHGAGMDHSVWQLQSRYVAHHGYRSIAIDLPGHGHSDGPALESIADMAAWTAKVTAQLDLGAVHVVGHSMGALVALELAVSNPDAVRSLVLLGVGSVMPVNDELKDSSVNDQGHAADLMTAWSHDKPTYIGGHDVPGYWQLGSSTQLIMRCPEGSLSADFAACDSYLGAIDAAKAIAAPTTVIIGQKDKMSSPKSTAPLVEALATEGSVNTVEIPAVGHMAMIEDSKAVRKTIMAHLATT